MAFARLLCLALVLQTVYCSGVAVEPAEEAIFSLTEDQAKYATDIYGKALARLTKNAITEECKQKIETQYKRYLEPLALEESGPFDRVTFWPQCPGGKKPGLLGQHFKSQPRPKPPPAVRPPPRVNNTLNPETLSILYVILAHDHAQFAIRMMKALHEPMHSFVVHVDKKSDVTYNAIISFARKHSNIHVLEERVSGVWGGFSLVNATLLGLQYAMDKNIHFDFAVDISGQSYPIKSNEMIRNTLSADPNSVYMDIKGEPNIPAPELWHHFVECDDRSHRITRITAPRGMYLYMGSQWFVLPRHVVSWLLTDPLPKSFITYLQNIMVADEHYFTTMIKNSPYCADIVGKNYNYLVFGEWEQALRARADARDWRKCNQPDPEHCGRSPTTLTKTFFRAVKSSRSLWARKFDPANSTSMEFVDMVDAMRKETAIDFNALEDEKTVFMIRQKDVVAEEATDVSSDITSTTSSSTSVSSDAALCLSLPLGSGKRLEASACDPYNEAQWFNLGQCITSDGKAPPRKKNSPVCGNKPADEADQFCFIKTAARQFIDANTSNIHSVPFCLDIAGENPNPGGTLIGYDCTGGWNQHFRVLPDCTISAVQPKATAVARGMKNAEEMTVCAEVQNAAVAKHVKTSKCPVTLADEKSQTFEFIHEFKGITWGKLLSRKRNKAEENIASPPPSASPTSSSTPVKKKPTKNPLASSWAKGNTDSGGIRKGDIQRNAEL